MLCFFIDCGLISVFVVFFVVVVAALLAAKLSRLLAEALQFRLDFEQFRHQIEEGLGQLGRARQRHLQYALDEGPLASGRIVPFQRREQRIQKHGLPGQMNQVRIDQLAE